MSFGSKNLRDRWSRAGGCVAVLALAAILGGVLFAGPASAASKPNLKGGEGGGEAEAIAGKITDPSFMRLVLNLIKDEKTGPGIEDVLKQLAVINAKLDVLDRKLDEIASQVVEIRTNQYWIELQKYNSAAEYVQEELADLGKTKDVEERQARSRRLAEFVLDKLAPYRRSIQNLVLAVPGGRKGIIGALSDQQKLGLRFWGQKETDNLTQAYNYYAAYQSLIASEVAQAKVALATPAQREKAEEDARAIGADAVEAIVKQRAELPKGFPGGMPWNVDLQTRQLWVTRSGAAPVSWAQATTEVAQSRALGFSNWRLPGSPDYEGIGPGCLQRSYRDPCAYATVVARRGWKLPTSCSGRNVWWTTSTSGGQIVGFLWADIGAYAGQVVYNPGTACVFQVRPVGDGERYFL